MTRFFSILITGLLVLLVFQETPSSATDVPFGGVGLQVVPTIHGDLVVLNVLESAPAADKGLLPGDLIYQVNDFPLQGSDFGKVISEHLWGPVGTSVELFYRRPGVAGERRVILQRTTIDPRLTVSPTVRNSSANTDKGN
ncbi:MAG: PDZ domain-containing protein [Desulfuromonadales bacterium]